MHIGLPDVDPGREKRPKPLEHQPFHIARRDAHPFLGFCGRSPARSDSET
jgi:hypothetical protein